MEGTFALKKRWLIYWVGKEKIQKLVSGVEVILSNNNKKDVIWLSSHFLFTFFANLKTGHRCTIFVYKKYCEFGGGDWWE